VSEEFIQKFALKVQRKKLLGRTTHKWKDNI
jgi:hypothetical protein